jgi:hypothetical protein
MNRILKTALALAAAGSVANADPGDNEWLELDSEINGLASSLQPSQDGMGWAALIRGVFTYSSDDIATGGSGVDGPDTSGFGFNDLDLAFWGNQGSYMWRISADIEFNESGLVHDVDNDLGIEDGYIRWACGEYFNAQMGQFKPGPLRSSTVDPEKQLFIDRTALGSNYDYWDQGIAAQGSWEQFGWWAAIFNGLNGHTRDHLYVVRLEWMLGAGAGMYEGAMGGSDELNATLGFSFLNDDTMGDVSGDGDTDTMAYIFDVNGNVSNFGFGAEVASLDDDYLGITDEDFSNIFDGGLNALVIADDSTPWNVTLSYLINPEWEVGVRYEDLDNGEVLGANGPDNALISAVVNWHTASKGAKWQAQWTDVDADNGFADGSIFEIGFSVGSTR